MGKKRRQKGLCKVVCYDLKIRNQTHSNIGLFEGRDYDLPASSTENMFSVVGRVGVPLPCSLGRLESLGRGCLAELVLTSAESGVSRPELQVTLRGPGQEAPIAAVQGTLD